MDRRSITHIPIATIFTDRTVIVEAIVCGKFAVNSRGSTLTTKPGGDTYTITHIATGYAAGYCFGLRNAQALARALDALLPDWDITAQDFTSPFSDRYSAFLAQAMPMIKAVTR